MINIKRITLVYLLFGLMIQLAYAAKPLHFGVLAFRPKTQTMTQWEPLAKYLATAINHEIEITTYNYTELEAALEHNRVDILLTNPGHYILSKYRNSISAPLATKVNQEFGHVLSTFGGVIFTRANRSDINDLNDLNGKIVAAVTNKESLGGYQMQAFELLEAGISLPSDDRILITGMPHDHVIDAVLNRQADIGFVRTGVIEELSSEGKLDLSRIKIINQQNLPNFPLIVSTKLYPEWPIAVMPWVEERLARKLSTALLSLSSDSEAAQIAGIQGFTIPSDYSSVEQILRVLHVTPFDKFSDFRFIDVWYKYTNWIITLGILLFLLAIAVTWLVIIYKRAQWLQTKFQQQSHYLGKIKVTI